MASTVMCGSIDDVNMVPRGLEPRTLRLLAVRSNQLSYETLETQGPANSELVANKAAFLGGGGGGALFNPLCGKVQLNSQKHQWSRGRIHRCHRCDPGSIPG